MREMRLLLVIISFIVVERSWSRLSPPLPKSCSQLVPSSECHTYRESDSDHWTYRWCLGSSLYQVPSKSSSGSSSSLIGRYAESKSTLNRRVYQNGTYCSASRSRRRGEVRLKCCPKHSKSKTASVFIANVYEPTPCRYIFDVCMQCLCDSPISMNETTSSEISAAQVNSLRKSAISLFYHGYRAYMRHGYPNDEIKPLTCRPTRQPQTAGTMLTLIDSLDTLALLDDHVLFGQAVGHVSGRLTFELDENTIEVINMYVTANSK